MAPLKLRKGMSVLLGADYGKLLVKTENPQFDHCPLATGFYRL